MLTFKPEVIPLDKELVFVPRSLIFLQVDDSAGHSWQALCEKNGTNILLVDPNIRKNMHLRLQIFYIENLKINKKTRFLKNN
jgi:hypothetical protein